MRALLLLAFLARPVASAKNTTAPSMGKPEKTCECSALQSCLELAWEPCFPASQQTAPELFWLRQRPREVWRSPCRRQWRNVEHFDPDYAHIKAALQCQTEHQLCYAAVNVSALTLADFPRDQLKPCWENALACQILNAQGCRHYDQDEVWQLCWLDNPHFAHFGSKFLDVLEEAWKCETLQSIQKSRDDLIKYL